LRSGAKVTVSIRPEQIRIHSQQTEGAVEGVVKAVLPLGPHVVYDVALPNGPSLRVSEPRETASELRALGASVNLKPISPAACRIFPVN
jgi:putative spermidine/putrescine transport system ATP-binding protein